MQTVEELREKMGGMDCEGDIESLWDTYYNSQYTPRRRNIRNFKQKIPRKSMDAVDMVVERKDDGVMTLDDFLDDE